MELLQREEKLEDTDIEQTKPETSEKEGEEEDEEEDEDKDSESDLLDDDEDSEENTVSLAVMEEALLPSILKKYLISLIRHLK